MTEETMSNTEAKNEVCSVKNDETENCEPCIFQDKKAPAEYWCPDCTELLCKSCYGHHRVLKATKSHDPYTLEEYLSVRDVVSKIDLMCKIHTDKQLDFFCKFHQSFCCGVCKFEHQLPSCDLQDINQSFSEQEKDEREINDLNVRMQHVLAQQLENKKTLEQHHNMFYEEIKRSRKEVEKYLDQFEEKIKVKFKEQFGISQTAINRNITEIESRSKEVVKRQSIIEKLKQCSKIPAIADFHTRVLIRTGNKEDESFLKDLSPVEFVSYEPVSLVDEKRQLITLTDKSLKYNFSNEDKNLVVWEHSEYEKSSSTVEAEAMIMSENTAQHDELSFSDMEHPSISEDEAEAFSDTCTSTDTEASTDSVTSTQEERFEKIHSFYIQKCKKGILIYCVRILPNGKMVMTETSEHRLLVYYESGQKAGEKKFDETPEMIAVISENQVAITVKIIVFIVDTDDLKIVKAINMHDVCFGIAFANGKLFVNCCHKGLTVMLPSGKQIRTIPFIKGSLYLCALSDDTIMSIKQGGNKVFHFNMQHKSTQKFKHNQLSNINDIVHDGLNSVFIASNNNEIWTLNYQTGVWKKVMNDTNELNTPYSIDFSQQINKLIVANNEGRSLSFYKVN